MRLFRNIIVLTGLLFISIHPCLANDAPLVRGDFKNSYKVEGTNTSFGFGGYVKLDFIYDFSGDGGDTINYRGMALDGTALEDEKQFRMHARQTRLNFTTLTPSSMGNIKTFIEFDFFGSAGNQLATNSDNPRLRRAELIFGPWLAGQTYGAFCDRYTNPMTINFSNQTGQVGIRQPLLMYTHKFSKNWLTQVSIENPEADGITMAGTPFKGDDNNFSDQMPDIGANVKFSWKWGHVQLAGLLRRLTYDDGTNDDSTFGYGVLASTKIKTFGKDDLRITFTFGDGIGRYLQEAVFSGAVLDTSGASPELTTQFAVGGNINYLHYWTAKLRTNIGAGFINIDLEKDILGASANTINENFISAGINVIYSPIKKMDIGIEFFYAARETGDGSEGDLNRVQAMVMYKF